MNLDNNVISNLCYFDSAGNPGAGLSGGLGFDESGRLVDITSGQPVPVIPEPATVSLLVLGLAGLGVMGRRRRRRGTSLHGRWS